MTKLTSVPAQGTVWLAMSHLSVKACGIALVLTGTRRCVGRARSGRDGLVPTSRCGWRATTDPTIGTTLRMPLR